MIVTVILGVCGLVMIFQGLFYPIKSLDSFTAGAAFFAAAAIAYQAHRNNVSDIQTTSRCYLEKYKETSEIIVNYLKSDKPTRRVCWVTAAKVTEMLIGLERKISSPADKDLIKIYQRVLAHDLYEFISTKPAMYFTGREDASSLDEALKKPPIVAMAGLIPRPHDIDHVYKSSIKTILDLMNLLWEDEAGYKYSNEEEFNNVIRSQYAHIAEYFAELKKHNLY